MKREIKRIHSALIIEPIITDIPGNDIVATIFGLVPHNLPNYYKDENMLYSLLLSIYS
jgi:hypothetical protein